MMVRVHILVGAVSTRNSVITSQVTRKKGRARFYVSAAVNTEIVGFLVVTLCGQLVSSEYQHAVFRAAQGGSFSAPFHNSEDHNLN